MTKKNDEFRKEALEHSPPDLGIFEIFRSLGYKIEDAIADLIDNSIAAEATKIKIEYEFDNGNPYLKIEDNGFGMHEANLKDAMIFGKSDKDRTRVLDLGRFGLGLKSASFSQCSRFTVVSKVVKGSSVLRCWDSDVIRNSGWFVSKEKANSTNKSGLEFEKGAKHGTIVLWEKLDRLFGDAKPDVNQFSSVFANIGKKLGLVFHRYIEEALINNSKLKLEVNGVDVIARNPFNFSRHNSINQFGIEKLEGGKIIIEPFLIPDFDDLNKDEIKNAEREGGLLTNQGIYLYRNKRLIVPGSWLDTGIISSEGTKSVRIKIDIIPEFDIEWKINVIKNTAGIPVNYRSTISKIISSTNNAAKDNISKKKRKIKRPQEKKGDIKNLWIEKTDLKRMALYQIDFEHPMVVEFFQYFVKTNQKEASLQFKLILELIQSNLPISKIISSKDDDILSEDIKIVENKRAIITFEKFLIKGMKSEKQIKLIINKILEND